MKNVNWILAFFIALMLCIGGVSAGKQGDTYITIKVGQIIKQDTQGYTDITVKPSDDATQYVKADYQGKDDMEYTGLKSTPIGKTADFEVGKKIVGVFYYKVVHVTVV